MNEDHVHILKDGRVFIDYGPVSMVLSATDGCRMLSGLCVEAFSVVENALKELAAFLPVLRRFPGDIQPDTLSGLPKIMLDAVSRVGEPTLTPMAAVAGTIADATADWLFEQGTEIVTANNGGDIAIRLREGRSLRLGILASLEGGEVDEVVTIRAEDGIGGICTSGLGGRSFTRGIANSVTVFSARCAHADACATHIANCSYIDSPRVHTALAGELDPTSDIASLTVVTGADSLTEEEIARALRQVELEAGRQQEAGNLYCVAADIQGRRLHYPIDHQLFTNHR